MRYSSLRCGGYIFLLLLIHSHSAYATVLKGCFPSPGSYETQYSRPLSPDENSQGSIITADAHLVGSGPTIYAQCNCPKTISSSAQVKGYSFASSPLMAGSTSGTGYLTEKLDIHVDGYNDAIDSPDGNGLYANTISTYPTLSPGGQAEKLTSIESTETVCSDDTRPVAGVPQRQFKWNIIFARLYVKSPILGEEIIPSTLVQQTSACLYYGSGMCMLSDSRPVSNIWFSGILSAPLSCTINAGSVIEVGFGAVASSDFIARGQPPKGYTLRNVDISFHCDNAAVSNTEKIKLTLSADEGVEDTESGLIGKMTGRDDIGVRVYDANSSNVRLDGNSEFPISLDEQGNGSIHMTAAPVSTKESRPEPGKFEGNVTIKMDLR
ncbi:MULTISPECIES: fimbrial protein [Enterobacterales]|uniref:fimbrial protein n=1 Tax=Enterobacterales TaxID=91347 RepID=UPI002ED7D174